MRMKSIIGLWIVAGVAVAVALGDEGLSKPPELKVLGRFVGTWDCEVVMKPAVWMPKEVREKTVEVNDLVMGGWFLQGSSKTWDGATRAIFMNTYDPAQKTYRIWRFAPGGSCEEMAGQWDEATSTLTRMFRPLSVFPPHRLWRISHIMIVKTRSTSHFTLAGCATR